MTSMPVSLKFLGTAARDAVARAGALSPCASPRVGTAVLQLPLSPRTPKTPQTNGPKTPPATPLVNMCQMPSAYAGDMSPQASSMMSPSLRRAMEVCQHSEVSPTLRMAAARLNSMAVDRKEPSTPSLSSPEVPEKPIPKPLPKLLGTARSSQGGPRVAVDLLQDGAGEGGNKPGRRYVHFEQRSVEACHHEAREHFLERQRQRAARRSGNFVI